MILFYIVILVLLVILFIGYFSFTRKANEKVSRPLNTELVSNRHIGRSYCLSCYRVLFRCDPITPGGNCYPCMKESIRESIVHKLLLISCKLPDDIIKVIRELSKISALDNFIFIPKGKTSTETFLKDFVNLPIVTFEAESEHWQYAIVTDCIVFRISTTNSILMIIPDGIIQYHREFSYQKLDQVLILIDQICQSLRGEKNWSSQEEFVVKILLDNGLVESFMRIH